MYSDSPSRGRAFSAVSSGAVLVALVLTSHCARCPGAVFMTQARKAETLVRLMWTTPPSTFLLIKKPNAPEVTPRPHLGHPSAISQVTSALVSLAATLCSGSLYDGGHRPTIVVEPPVYADLTTAATFPPRWRTS